MTEFDKGMNELNKAASDFFEEITKELRIVDLVHWLERRLNAAMTFYWNYKLQQ